MVVGSTYWTVDAETFALTADNYYIRHINKVVTLLGMFFAYNKWYKSTIEDFYICVRSFEYGNSVDLTIWYKGLKYDISASYLRGYVIINKIHKIEQVELVCYVSFNNEDGTILLLSPDTKPITVPIEYGEKSNKPEDYSVLDMSKENPTCFFDLWHTKVYLKDDCIVSKDGKYSLVADSMEKTPTFVINDNGMAVQVFLYVHELNYIRSCLGNCRIQFVLNSGDTISSKINDELSAIANNKDLVLNIKGNCFSIQLENISKEHTDMIVLEKDCEYYLHYGGILTKLCETTNGITKIDKATFNRKLLFN